MKTIVAIDPGPTHSAWIVSDADRGRLLKIRGMGIEHNGDVLDAVVALAPLTDAVVGIEMVACYGMAVGAEVFETCVWIGRFIEQLGVEPIRVYRRDVKMKLCDSMRAKDPNVRQALIDRYGVVGTKKKPGTLYGVKTHLWAALGVADYLASL